MASTTSKVIEGYLDTLFGPDDMLQGLFVEEDAPELSETVEDLLSTIRIPRDHQMIPVRDPQTREEGILAALSMWKLYSNLPISKLKQHCLDQARRWLQLKPN